jgi:5-methylcytosine-specific restriction endonuclease McrA
MPGDPFYHTDTWRKLRRQALERDRHTCVVEGCGKRATTVDHIVSRSKGGPNALPNLRSLCFDHDNQIKERRDGTRRSGGNLRVRGSNQTGMPLDPHHPWHAGGVRK